MGNKYILPILTLILGLFAGAMFQGKGMGPRIQNNGTEDMNKINALGSRLQNCEAKFERSTILYDGALFTDRRWLIPVDVEPIEIGNRSGASFSHYDPNTQMETVKFKPKTQP